MAYLFKVFFRNPSGVHPQKLVQSMARGRKCQAFFCENRTRSDFETFKSPGGILTLAEAEVTIYQNAKEKEVT